LGITVDRRICVNLPPSFLSALSRPNGQEQSPVLDKWRELRRAVAIDLNDKQWQQPCAWRENFIQHNLRNGIADGYVQPTSGLFVFASLFDISGDPKVEAHRFHSFVTTTLYSAFQEFLFEDPATTQSLSSHARLTLTPTELEIVKWIRSGKTNREIAIILNKSEHTVKTQVHIILKKTMLSNRTLLASTRLW
jgi:DNA-binding CsgD family transcriptional regulator